MHANEQGYYGEYGGAYVPEMLYKPIEELKRAFAYFKEDESFTKEYLELLKNYVGRPTPLYHAKNLSRKYKAKVFLKREDLNHTGAHKINNSIGQVLLAKKMGKNRVIAETGAGQHGVATATACALLGIECVVYMGEIDIKRQAPNVARMKMLGASVVPAYSGSKTLKDATNEAIRAWINDPEAYYVIGSVVGPHPYPEIVTYFQSVIGHEIKDQLNELGCFQEVDMIIACVGGGSNAAGAFSEFIGEKVDLVIAEGAGKGLETNQTAATSILGTVGVIHGSKTLMMQSAEGQITEPYSISAGLDYPGIGPLHAHLLKTGRVKSLPITDADALRAANELCQLEGIIPALESAHALGALSKMDMEGKTVVVNLSGRGDKDLETYINHL